MEGPPTHENKLASTVWSYAHGLLFRPGFPQLLEKYALEGLDMPYIMEQFRKEAYLEKLKKRQRH